MRTLDISETHDGLAIVSGFGAKDWSTAVYVDGKLIASGRDGFDDERHPATALAKHLATKAGYAWVERSTHICWRMSSYSDIPESLAEYDATTLAAYRTASEQKYLETAQDANVPRTVGEERYDVSEAFALSGGDEEQFDTWYETWLANQKSFNDLHQAEMDKFLLLEARLYNQETPELRQAEAEQRKVLQALFTAYLLEVYRADKPLDSVAKRAWSAQ